MISRNIPSCRNMRIGNTVRYIAASGESEEKLGRLWAVNCNAGDSVERLDHIINEMESVESLTARGGISQCYHFVVSFKDERPPDDVMVSIDREFADALGVGEHQRVAATHINTEHFHMHIAYNLVHPGTHRVHRMDYDFYVQDRTCRAVEAKYGLKAGKGIDYGRDRNPMPKRARDREARDWEQSFSGYVLEFADKLDSWWYTAKTWEKVHADFAEFGLRLVPWGKGLVIQDIGHRGRNIKASILGRKFGKPGMEGRFGPYMPPSTKRHEREAKSRFGPRPTTRHGGQSELWRKYQNTPKGRRAPDGNIVSSWRAFLVSEALHDPLAWDIIDQHERELKEAALEEEQELEQGMERGMSL